MNIFKKAKQNQINGKGYRASKSKTVWKNKTVGWNWISVSWGIRWSDKIQYFPIWNTSHNCQNSILFGVWKLYIEFTYHKKHGIKYSTN